MNKHFAFIALFLLFSSCATYHSKYANDEGQKDILTTKEVSHTFYLIGDAGLSPMGEMNPALQVFKNRLDKADKNSTAIFLGDNIYPAGLPNPKDSTVAYRTARSHLNAQLKTVENYNGRILFIPGNHDWYTEGIIGLKRQENYIQKKLGDKDTFAPKDGCPMEVIDVSDDAVIIALDTEWYLTNWDKRPSINDDCEIKSREKFLEELEGAIKEHAGKTVILAMHHPLFSYGPHGGQYTRKQQFYPKSKFGPLPILGSFVNLFRKSAGASSEDMQNKRYRELIKRITTLAQYTEKVIAASGHEHSLQYIIEQNVPQIVSGSGAKSGATKLLNGSKFSTGEMGYAVLEIYVDGSSRVRYYGVDNEIKEKFLFTSEVYTRDTTVNYKNLPTKFPKTIQASVYTEDEVDKSAFFRAIWGERYRKYYGTKVTAPTVLLDTLYGGLQPVRKGGGHQSKSLRLEDGSGRQFVMRALRKEAERYLQAMAFKDKYIIGEFQDTFTEGILEDFYTGAHPYAPFTIGELSEAIDLYHTNPVLFYVPKQPALKEFNGDFGDELYLIEEHVSKGHEDEASFGFAKDIENTYKLLDKLRDDEKYVVDTDLYIRARLFDMVIGDWDRHVDQWRWAEFIDKENDKIIYRPIPRDRDQAYSIMGDGILMGISTRIIPPLKLMEGFKDNVRNVKTFNSSPFSLDMALLNETLLSQWSTQAEYIRKHLTEAVIDSSFARFPQEVRDEKTLQIKRILLSRIEKLPELAEDYYGELNKYAVVKGTDKDDWFEINGIDGGHTQVKAYRIIEGKKSKLFYDKIFEGTLTREIWIYGLDDDDYFEARGEEVNNIRVKIVGGNGNDIYDVQGSKKISVFDYKTKEITLKNLVGAKLRLTDDYTTNTYQPLKLINNLNQLVPTIGFNPDDGLRLGISNTYTHYGFRQNPFTSQHKVNGAFYFATSGFDINYTGEFANIFDKWNFGVTTRFTSPNFSTNFFGFGNDTPNLDEELGLDFNRVKLRTMSIAPALIWRGDLGASVNIAVSYENILIEGTPNRFVDDFFDQNPIDNGNSFMGMDFAYNYMNSDNEAFPTVGMAAYLNVGFKTHLSGNDGTYAYIVPSLSLDQKLIPNGNLVLAAKWKGHFNIGNGFEFYQAANIGGVDGLRGFRNQRFIGKTAYYQNTDLRYRLIKMKTGLLPMSLGMYGGFDYGRVWLASEDSDRWHTSYGGGFFLNGADILSARVALFNSQDGPRLTFGVGFGF